MKKRHGISVALAAAMTLSAGVASADSNIGAFAVGAAVGALVNQSVNNNKKKKRSYSANSYTRQQNREVQAALNTFGFNAGVVDGSLGHRSRTAISSYQVYMSYPVTGYLQEYQRANLVSAHHRLNAGGATAYPQVVANEGTRGLLKAFADPNYASRYNQPDTSTVTAAAPVPAAPALAPVPAPVTTAVSAPLAPAGLAPLDLTAVTPVNSMLKHCDSVESKTRANNGVILASNVTNADQALGEQFCGARDYSIDQLNSIKAAASLDDAQLVAACGQITDAMSQVTALVDQYTVQNISASARTVVNQLANGDMDTAAGYGQLCLGMGYREDDSSMALAGAVVMLGVGKMPYAELVGHHLRWGFGTAQAPVESSAWYNTALTAMADGAIPAVLPAKSEERNAIINTSVNRPVGAFQPVQTSGALPTLNLGNN
ncbi:MAG: peptidoglycan-binding domain-containing protein [Roseobacter sp.]